MNFLETSGASTRCRTSSKNCAFEAIGPVIRFSGNRNENPSLDVVKRMVAQGVVVYRSVQNREDP